MRKTYGEIKDQYRAMQKTKDYLDGNMFSIESVMARSEKCVVMGCGSSYSIAKSAALMIQLRLGKRVMAVACGDLLLHFKEYLSILEGCVLVVLSRSGETSEAVLAIEEMRKAGIGFEVLSLTCKEHSTLEKLSTLTLCMPWAFDESVCQTRTVSCLYYACAYLTAKLAGQEMRLAMLAALVLHGDDYLAKVDEAAKALAQRDWTHAVVLGDGELGGIAEEGALAFKEICQLPSNYYHVLDVRHGPMVLVGEKTMIIACISNSDSNMERDLVTDLVKKGAAVIVVSDTPFALEGVLSISFGASLDQAARGLSLIAVCQLLAYHKSFLTGADPDAPDGLDAWIELKQY